MDDVQLLAQYVERGSKDAFRTLVERHSQMVYATCLRELGNAGDAEDAAQAVFITLAQKAKSIRDGDALPGWLFKTANLVVSHMKREYARRKRREAEVAAMAQKEAITAREGAQWEEVRVHLNAAILSLSRRQQDAVVRYYLEGKSQKEVAGELGCSEEAVKKRISYGLRKLREKLAKKGVVLSVATLTGFFTTKAVQAAPAGLAQSCHAAAMASLTGDVAAFSTASLIAKGVMKMMMLAKVKIVATSVCLVMAAGGGTHVALKAMEREEPVIAIEKGEVVKVEKVEVAEAKLRIPPLEELSTAGRLGDCEVRVTRVSVSGAKEYNASGIDLTHVETGRVSTVPGRRGPAVRRLEWTGGGCVLTFNNARGKATQVVEVAAFIRPVKVDGGKFDVRTGALRGVRRIVWGDEKLHPLGHLEGVIYLPGAKLVRGVMTGVRRIVWDGKLPAGKQKTIKFERGKAEVVVNGACTIIVRITDNAGNRLWLRSEPTAVIIAL